MALLRNQKSFIFPAPPPSPIATGRGLKSAAVDDYVLAEYLENNLRIPDLSLPQSRHSPISHPVEIDLGLLSLRDDDSIHLLLRSALQFGVFSIIGHGISADELRSMMAEAEKVFPIPVVLKRDPNRLKFLTFSSGNTGIRGEIGPEKHRNLSQTMDYLFGELESISDMVGLIISEFVGNKKHGEEGFHFPGRDPILCLHKSMGPNLSYNDSYHFALSFFLSGNDNEFLVQSARGPLLFNSPAGSIIVSVRKQFKEWRNGEFKDVAGEPNLVLNSDGSSSFFVEFMCTPSTLTDNNAQQLRKISLHDQLLIVLIICVLYNFFTYIS